MTKRKRIWIDDACYHITHRCHGREFLFKFEKYRNIYHKQLFEAGKRFDIDFLNYMVTSNHVHLLVTSRHSEQIPDALQFIHSTAGQAYNRARQREGAFWTDRFSSTLIQSGEHLRQCFLYIDLNMVRAGVVKHPAEWKHCGYSELAEERKRYRIINVESLLQCMEFRKFEDFKSWHRLALKEKLKKNDLKREQYWSNAIALGEPDWLCSIASQSGLKRYKIEEENSYTHFLMGKK